MKHLDDLRDVIHKLHGAKATHVESVPITEKFNGETVWDGTVEVFDLDDHPNASRAYAWSHDTDSGEKHHVTVLHVPPVVSPILAVRAALIQEYRNAQTA